MKLILSKRLCHKHLIRAEQITELRIGDLFIRKYKHEKLSDCNIYTLSAVSYGEYALINVNWGTRILNPVRCTLANLSKGELKILLPALGITSETYKIRE